MFSYRSLSPVFVHQAIIALCVIGVVFFLQEPLGILGLLLLPQAPVLPDQDEDDEEVDVKSPMGFVDSND